MWKILIFPLQVSAYYACSANLADASFSDTESCTSSHIIEAVEQDKLCSPRSVVVQLPWPNNTYTKQMTPSHIELLQCTGGCHRTSRSCIPTHTRQRKVPVLIAKCGVSSGKCEKQCVDYHVEDHITCACECNVTEDACNSATHYHNNDLCSCECKDIIGKRDCLDQNKIWDEMSCKCGCPVHQTCSDKMEFSNVTCTCETVKLNNEIEIQDDRIECNKIYSSLNWELVIITCLSGVIVILLMIIVILIRRLKMIKSMNSKLESEKQDDYAEDIKEESAMYSSDCDIYFPSSSSGFGSEISRNDIYEIVNIKEDIKQATIKQDKLDTIILQLPSYSAKENSIAFENSLQSIDETLRLLKESADQL